MVYEVLSKMDKEFIAQNNWVFGLFPLSGVFGSRNTTFRKLDVSFNEGQSINMKIK
jgi:hypothetical protein